MNTDSKPKRFTILLDRAPFILFVESPDYISASPLLRSMGFSNEDAIVPLEIYEQTPLLRVFAAINNRPDPIAYSIIEALAYAIGTLYTFHLSHLNSNKWQEYIKWQKAEAKPEPTGYFTIAVSKFIHELSIIDEVNVVLDEDNCDGVINLESLDINAPFPLALLKECTMEIYNIIVQKSVGRITADKVKSKYLSVMQSGHDTFNYISLRLIEKDLIAVLTTANVTIEE